MANVFDPRFASIAAHSSSHQKHDIHSPLVPANSDGLPHSDTFLLVGVPCPGRASLISADALFPWDVRKAEGLAGATIVQRGEELARPVFAVDLWAPSQWADWQIFAARFLKRGAIITPGSLQSAAMGILHPVLNAPPWLVSEVVVEKVTAPRQDDDGIWHLEIHFLAFRIPKFVPAAKPDAAFRSTQAPISSAKDAAQAALVALTARYNNLAAGGQ